MLRFVAALLALVLTGCLATFPVDGGTVHVDQRLSPSVQAAIARAVTDWCAATRGRVCPKLVQGRGPFAFVLEGQSTVTSATTHQRFRTVQIGLDLGKIHPTYWVAAIKHEIGHAYDLEHGPGLMRSADQGGPWARKGVPFGCIDQRTLAALCKEIGGCPRDATPECTEP